MEQAAMVHAIWGWSFPYRWNIWMPIDGIANTWDCARRIFWSLVAFGMDSCPGSIERNAEFYNRQSPQVAANPSVLFMSLMSSNNLNLVGFKKSFISLILGDIWTLLNRVIASLTGWLLVSLWTDVDRRMIWHCYHDQVRQGWLQLPGRLFAGSASIYFSSIFW